ncbi:hypothetical protein BH09ACT11_BH09ACT11_06520 [soil metagenome]
MIRPEPSLGVRQVTTAVACESETLAEQACLQQVLAGLDALLACEPGRLPAAVKPDLLGLVGAAEAKLAAFKLRFLATASDAARLAGARDIASWYADQTHTDTGAARSAHRTAQNLQSAPRVADALGSGAVSPDQATRILDSLTNLPPQTPVGLRRKAEDALVEAARVLPPTKLAAKGKGILDEVDPAGHHHQLATTLEAEQAAAWAKTRARFTDRGDGTTDIEATVPTHVASRLKTVLEAHTSPRSTNPDTNRWRTTEGNLIGNPTRLGRALCTVIETLDPVGLPAHGGTATTILITIDHRDLIADLGTAGVLDTNDTMIPAAEARRLACNASLIPVVLGGDSQPLDIGRTARLFKPHQVTAMRHRDRTCRAEGCTIPAAWCEAHHLKPWSQGGATDLTNGTLLCSHHHHLIHHPHYQHARQPNGRIQIRLRT